MTCRNDVDVAKMSISAPRVRLFRQTCGAESDILAAGLASVADENAFNCFPRDPHLSFVWFQIGAAGARPVASAST